MNVVNSSKGKSGKRTAWIVGGVVITALGITVWQSWGHLKFWWQFESLGRNQQGLPEFKHRQTGVVFVRVPGGTFMMGSPEDEEYREVEEYQHEVVLSPFLIAKYEVSEGEWKKTMKANQGDLKGDDFPVDFISWEASQDFCKRGGLELPTEAQWEYACRAGTTGEFGGTGKLGEMAWYSDNSDVRGFKNCKHRRGQKKPNDFGLYDMHGNVPEWCQDTYCEDFYKQPAANIPNPLCLSESEYVVCRGGGWWDDDYGCRSACRGFMRYYHFDYFGFRPAFYPLP